ncbi:hypothetical protein RKD25_008885 [Streptomyces sp. SAI-124]|uniref:hypothetical protein n=1 Tax=Streptomyces sp. SAI-124 TaxID=3377730 RepID=UPI003C7AC3C0
MSDNPLDNLPQWVRNLFFLLTGELLTDANSVKAYFDRLPYVALGRELNALRGQLAKAGDDIARALPDEVGRAYRRAVGPLIGEGGQDILRDFARSLDEIAENRRKASTSILKAQWDIVAELVRLAIEIAFLTLLSYFTGGLSASQIFLAKLRSRLVLLLTVNRLLKSLHVAPSLTEAIDEILQSIAVQVALMKFGPDGRRPRGLDGKDIYLSGLTGFLAGGLTSLVGNFGKNVVDGYKLNYLKIGDDFKPGPDGLGGVGRLTGGPHHRPGPDGSPGAEVNRLPDGKSGGGHGLGGGLNSYSGGPGRFPDSYNFRLGPNSWRNGRVWQYNTDRPWALGGYYGLKGTDEFFAAGVGETAAEVLVNGAFYGDWSWQWHTFLGAGLSSFPEAVFSGAGVNGGAQLRGVIDRLTGGFRGHSGGGPVTETGKGSDAGKGTDADTGKGSGAGVDVDMLGDPPPPYVPGGLLPATESLPPSSLVSPPPSSLSPWPAPLLPLSSVPDGWSVAGGEGELWGHLLGGSAGVRERLLVDLAALRGSAEPGPVEVEVREHLHERLTGGPDGLVGSGVRVVPVGEGPSVLGDAEEVRRALDGLGVPVVVDTPPVAGASGAQRVVNGPDTSDVSDSGAAGAASPLDVRGGSGTGVGPGVTGGAGGVVQRPGPVESPPAGVVPQGSPSVDADAPSPLDEDGSPFPGGDGSPSPVVGTSSSDGDGSSSPGVDAVLGETGAAGGAFGAGAAGESLVRVVVSPGPLPLPGVGSAGASELLDLVGADQVVVLGPVVQDGVGRVVRPAVELLREGPEAAVRVRPLAGPVVAPGGGGARDVEAGAGGAAGAVGDVAGGQAGRGLAGVVFPGADVLLPLADALGVVPESVVRLVTESPGTVDGNPADPVDPAGALRVAGEGAPGSVPGLDSAGSDGLRPVTQSGSSFESSPLVVSGSSASSGFEGEPARDVFLESGGGLDADAVPLPDSAVPVPSVFAATATEPVSVSGRVAVRSAGGLIETVDGAPVPVERLRRLVSESAAGPMAGRVVERLTVSQPPSADNTPQGRDRMALLGQNTFRHVRTTSTSEPAPASSSAPAPATSRAPASTSTPATEPASTPAPTSTPAPAPAPDAASASAAASVSGRFVFSGGSVPLPGGGTGRGVDVFVGHGTSRTVVLGTDDPDRPTVRVSGPQLGRLLLSWGAGGPDSRWVLFSCETGRQPAVAGLPVAQHAVNVLGDGPVVWGPTTAAGTARGADGSVHAVLAEGVDGPGRLRMFTAEPADEALDDLARVVRLHQGAGPADGFARTRTLQQVRTVREVLDDPRAERSVENHRLLAGLAFVDGLRWRDARVAARYGDARMTADLLRRMVRDYRGVAGSGSGPVGVGVSGSGAEPTVGEYRAFLDAAERLWEEAGADATLDALLPPVSVLSPDHLVSPGDAAGLAVAPSARVVWSLSDTPLPLAQLGLNAEDTAELTRRIHNPQTTGHVLDDPGQDVPPPHGPAHRPGLANTVHADDTAFRRLPTPADGNSLFQALLDTARSQEVPPAWAARSIAGLRSLLRERLTDSELAATADQVLGDPVLAVVDQLRMAAFNAERDPDEKTRILDEWNRIAQTVVADGNPVEWQRILHESPYPELAQVAPTPDDARRLGSGGLLAAAAERPGLWSSPFAGLLPEALVHTLDLDLRIVGPDPHTPGSIRVTFLHPGGRGGTLHLAHDGTDHYDGLIPVEALPTEGTPPPSAADQSVPDQSAPDQHGATPAPDLVRDEGGDRDTETPDRGDPVPLETQLERYRPARLITGRDVTPPGPPPRTVTFEDGSRLPAALISPDADPLEGDDGSPQTAPTGLFTGLGAVTLRSPERVAEEILGQLPADVRAQFDEAELLGLLREQPGAFTAPRGARFVGREKSGVAHEMTVEAVPYHRWERFSDVNGTAIRMITQQAVMSGTGGGRTVGFGRRFGFGFTVATPISFLVRVSASLGWLRKTGYNLATQAVNQFEYRTQEGSHLHLDDVHYRVRVVRVTEAPKTGGRNSGTESPESGPRWERRPVHQAEFAVRDGLSWRLPDVLTVPSEGLRRAPESLTFPDGVESRAGGAIALHLTDPPEDLALAISGARPGSSAHRTLVSFLRPGRLLGLYGRLSGEVSGPELTRGRGQRPLGHLIVERSIPHRATLVAESVKAEFRDTTQTTFKNERGHARETLLGVEVATGPSQIWPGPEVDVRLRAGPVGRLDLAAGRTHQVSVDATRKVIGRVRNQPIALYRVERTIMVRGAGQPRSAARPVRVVSLDWMTTQDARRLAGWDSRSPGQAGPNPEAEPPAPWYLTREDPVHLGGQTRVEGFRPVNASNNPLPDREQEGQESSSWQDHDGQPGIANPQDPRLKAFADSVLDALHALYPMLFVPPSMREHPRLARFWYGDSRVRTGLDNERQVREALNGSTLEKVLDVLQTTGIPVMVVEDGKLRRGHHTVILKVRLSDRRYETSMTERTVRAGLVGTEVAGQGQQASSALSGGSELGVSARNHDDDAEAGAPEHSGFGVFGARFGRTVRKGGRSSVTSVHDHLVSLEGAHLFSYRVELTASFEGHRRPRGWTRMVTVGMLGAGLFVSKVHERPLFSEGGETIGRVELSVPMAHSSERYAPAGTPPAEPAPAPADFSAAEAELLLDGSLTQNTDSDDQRLTDQLLRAPHVVVSVEGGEERQRLVQDASERASGNSWHASAPGSPVRTALRRAMANLSIAGQLGQYLGPFGSRVTGLHGAGPLQVHYFKAAIRGELHNLRVQSDPKQAKFEATLGYDHRVAGTESDTSRATVGFQGAHRPLEHVSGQETAAIGNHGVAPQYAWGWGGVTSRTVSRGRSNILSYAGRTYLVVADVVESLAVRDRWTAAMGTVGTRSGAGVRSVAGRLGRTLDRGRAAVAAGAQYIRDAVMFHLPMRDAIEAGLAPDGLGTTTPSALGGGYRVPALLDRRFLTHPSGRLDGSPIVPVLMEQLREIGVPSHDREQILQRLSPDFLRAHLQQLVTEGVTLPVRYRAWSRPHHLPVGGSPGQMQFKLTPVTTTVERLRTGFELEDYRTAGRDASDAAYQDHGTLVAYAGGHRPAESGVLAVNPALQGAAAHQRSTTRGETAGASSSPNLVTTQALGEIVTTYVLTVTMTDAAGDRLPPTASATVGSVNEYVPIGLLTPDGDGADGALTEQEVPTPERAVRMLTATQTDQSSIDAWRLPVGDPASGRPDPDVLPFDDRLGTGFVAMDVLGASNVRDALTLATARADGLHAPGEERGKRYTGDDLAAQVRAARRTSLTALGTAPAQSQHDVTAQVSLSSGLRESLGANGSPLPVQASAELLGQFHTANSRLYARMHRRGARLLAVENAPRMENMDRARTADGLTVGILDNIDSAGGATPLVGADSVAATVPLGATNDGTAANATVDTMLGIHRMAVAARSMLFAVPVRWLAVVEAEHRITHGRPLRWFGTGGRGRRAAEAETTALIWLREDLARDYGLVDDTTFPTEVADAWDAMAKAAADLATAEKRYFDARARTRDTWLDLSEEEQAALGGPTVLSQDMSASPAVTAWQAARDEVRRWEQRLDDAAADHHRLYLAASRLTAHHQGSPLVPVPDAPQEYTKPIWPTEAPEPYTITAGDPTARRALTSPDGITVRELYEVPHDGASFYHALFAAASVRGRLPHLLGTDLADRFVNAPGDPDVTAEAVDAARNRLARALGEDGNEDLVEALALDATDTFTQDEIDAAGVRFTPAEQAEFDTLGRLPQNFWPTPEQRIGLAVAALSRPFAPEPRQGAAQSQGDRSAPAVGRAGDHGGADLLPALAARVMGTPVTVVTGEGREQLFLPHGTDPATVDPAADPVLFFAKGFFQAALPPGTPAPTTTALPAPVTDPSGTETENTAPTSAAPAKPHVHRSHATPPWMPPKDSTAPRYRVDRHGVLTAPDGATYTQGAVTGRGNGFFGALSSALLHAAGQPGRDSGEAARLRVRADMPPAQLMRLNGLPGDPGRRDALFNPPPLRVEPGAPAPSADALEGHLRRHLATAPWSPDADQAVAEWAAAATGTTVTLIEENGTAHTYPGPSADAPHLRLRRRGGDFVPLIMLTPAPELSASQTTGTGMTGAQTGSPGDAGLVPPSPPAPEQDPASVPVPASTVSSADSEVRDLQGADSDGEEAFELYLLSPSPRSKASRSADDSGAPFWTTEGWLNTVFGPQQRTVPGARLRETSEALYELVREASGSQSTPQALRSGLIRVTRRVLHMSSAAGPGAMDFHLLGSLALDASSDDLESTENLARYFIERQIETERDALGEATLLRGDDGRVVGRDYTGAQGPAPKLDSYRMRGRGRVVQQPAPWDEAYLVVGTAQGRAVRIVTPGRTFWTESPDELAMLISYDSRRPRNADVVLMLPSPFAAAVAPLVAGTTGRQVWYPKVAADVVTHPTAGTRHLMLDVNAGYTGESWASVEPVGRGLPGASDFSRDSGSDPDSDDEQLSSDGDAEFERLADQAVAARMIEGRRARPLTTREYNVIDRRGAGVLFTPPLSTDVGEVRADDGADPDEPALVLPYQDRGDVRMADRPPLYISADRTLATLVTEDGTPVRSQQVYATRTAIARSSAQLAAAGAGVRLKADESVGVMLPREDGSFGEPLFLVEPEFLTASGGSEHAFTRDFAQMVAGGQTAPLSHIVFRGPTGGAIATAPVNGLHGREVTGTHHLADALTEVAEGTRAAGGVTPRWAAGQTGRDLRVTGGVVGAPTPGVRYGRALSYEPQDNPLRLRLASAAQRAGVNEYAWAEVGEGYLIQSISSMMESGPQLFTHNHAKPGDRVGPHAPYHFAQVVLASEDGAHQVTLENETHSRSELPAELLDDVVDENLDRYGEDELLRMAEMAGRRADEARRGGADEAGRARLESFARVARALADLHQAEQLLFYFDEERPEYALAQREIAEARSRAREQIRAAAPVLDSKDLWYFRAYSKRPGESAHEVNAELLSENAPAFANPLTTVVVHGHAPRRGHRIIRFEERRHALSDVHAGTIDGLARTLARVGWWNRAHGLPMPSVTITGYGNRSQSSGQNRADAVGKALGAKLAEVLNASQADVSGPRLSVRDFALTLSAKRARSAADPAHGRIVTVEIDDHRAVPVEVPESFGQTAVAGEPALTEAPAPEPTTTAETEDARPASEESSAATERPLSRPSGQTSQPAPERRNSDAPPWVQARIRYAEEAAAFDKRLGEYLSEHEAVVAEYRKMAQAAVGDRPPSASGQPVGVRRQQQVQGRRRRQVPPGSYPGAAERQSAGACGVHLRGHLQRLRARHARWPRGAEPGHRGGAAESAAARDLRGVHAAGAGDCAVGGHATGGEGSRYHGTPGVGGHSCAPRRRTSPVECGGAADRCQRSWPDVDTGDVGVRHPDECRIAGGLRGLGWPCGDRHRRKHAPFYAARRPDAGAVGP